MKSFYKVSFRYLSFPQSAQTLDHTESKSFGSSFCWKYCLQFCSSQCSLRLMSMGKRLLEAELHSCGILNLCHIEAIPSLLQELIPGSQGSCMEMLTRHVSYYGRGSLVVCYG